VIAESGTLAEPSPFIAESRTPAESRPACLCASECSPLVAESGSVALSSPCIAESRTPAESSPLAETSPLIAESRTRAETRPEASGRRG
jgi:hypothetical protein